MHTHTYCCSAVFWYAAGLYGYVKYCNFFVHNMAPSKQNANIQMI